MNLIKLYQQKKRCQKQKKSFKKLFCLPFLLFLCQCPSGCVAVCFWSSVSFIVCHWRGSHRCRHAEDTDHGFFLCCIHIYGLHNCSITWNRQNDCPDHYHTPRFLCIPYHMDLHDLCLDSYHSVTLSAVCFFVAYHFSRRNHLFYYQLSETEMLNNCHFLKFSLFFYCFYWWIMYN